MSSQHPPLVRTRLSIMMFLEFFVWGSWGLAIFGYANSTLKFSGSQIGWLGAVTAIGAIVSLMIGPIADRLFPAQRVLGALHVLGGVCLLLAGQQTSFIGMMTMMMLNGLAFMPTLALANSVAFRHIPDPARFPRIAVMGTIGWILANLSTDILLGGAVKPNFLFQAGIGGIILGIYCWTLPNTAPTDTQTGGSSFGTNVRKLLKDPLLMTFVVCVFIASVPACGYFFTLIVPMLQQRGYPSPVALTTLNQFAEIVFMFTMPWFVAKLGLRRVVLIGMLAWAVRYLFFACPEFSMALIGLILHGFCYSFFYVGSYMYVDSKVPEDLKSTAQSLLTFLLVGVGWFLGSKFGGFMMEQNAPPVPSMASLGGMEDDTRPLPPWDDPNASTSVWRYLDLSGTVNALLKGEPQQTAAATDEAKDLGAAVDANSDGKITDAEIAAIGDEGVTIAGVEYSREDISAIFKGIYFLDTGDETPGAEMSLTRDQWLKAQSCDWGPIWLWPSAGLFAILVVFAIGTREKPKPEDAASEDAEDTGDQPEAPSEQ